MDTYTANDEETLEASNQILMVAKKELRTIDEDTEEAEIKRRILCAFVAAKKEQQRQEKLIKKQHEEKHTFLHIEITHVVATAYWMATEGIDDFEDVHPISEAGRKLLTFANACAAMHSISSAQSALCDNYLFGEDMGEELLAMLDNYKF